MKANSYDPPSVAEIVSAQDENDNLRLLLAQRRYYSRAKRWAVARYSGLGLIALLAPIVTAISPDLAVVAGAAAALSFVLGRTLFLWMERRGSAKGAVVQEMFDMSVFGMPPVSAREVRVGPEQIARIVGKPKDAERAIRKEKLSGWYPLDSRLNGGDAIAIAQRANAAYSQRLLALNAAVWLWIMVGWAGVAVALSIIFEFTLTVALLSVALPVLPPLLDTFDEWRRVHNAGKERRALADEIEDTLNDPAIAHVDGDRLLTWQGQLFGLRRDAPQVPNLVYKLVRDENERVMSEAARKLAEVVIEKGAAEK